MSGHIRHLAISHSHVFLVNSRLGHFSAPASLRVPLSLSYGVNLPSSLAVIHSSTLGFSPHPPVSVYGTGRYTLHDLKLFLLVWLPALSAHPKARSSVPVQLTPTRFNHLFRQMAAVSLPGHLISCATGCGIFTALSSGSPIGYPLVPALPRDG